MNFRSEYLNYFLFTNYSFQISSQQAFMVKEKKHKIYLQDGGQGGNLGYPVERF